MVLKTIGKTVIVFGLLKVFAVVFQNILCSDFKSNFLPQPSSQDNTLHSHSIAFRLSVHMIMFSSMTGTLSSLQ
jgi:hypothetical protein